MWFFRLLCLGCLLSAAGLVTAGLATPYTRSRRSTPPPPPTPDHTAAAAARTLDEAIARMDAKRRAWLETNVWGKVDAGDASWEVQGRYLVAPNHRFRLELTTRHGQAEVISHSISDGSTLWEAMRTSNGKWNDIEPGDIRGLTDDARTAAPLPLLVFHPWFHGFAPLLKDMRDRLRWLRQETVRRGGRLYLRLTGTWTDDARRELAPPNMRWPEDLPRQCRLYMDASTLWPHRIEWWADPDNGGDRLVLQMEFREPVFRRPLTPQRSFEEFVFAPPR